LLHYYIVVHKVLLLARELGLGGTERQLAETALALDRAKFEPHVGCFSSGGFRSNELREAGVPILELNVRSFVSASAAAGARRLGAYLRSQRIELVHAFDVPADLFGVPAARFYRAPVVLSSQRASRALTPGITRQLLRATDRLAHGIVVNSKAVAHELVAEDGVSEKKIRLVYNGVDTARFCREGPRADLSLPTSGIVIGVVCALRPEKGLPVLIEAFTKIRPAYPQAQLAIVGSGPMLGELQSAAGAGCHFYPAVQDVAPWLRAIDVFVLPSLSEALSDVVPWHPMWAATRSWCATARAGCCFRRAIPQAWRNSSRDCCAIRNCGVDWQRMLSQGCTTDSRARRRRGAWARCTWSFL
jgi:glycosyltransferase involved in cell wall biosynthesis